MTTPLEAALCYSKSGYRPIPIIRGLKKPRIKWKRFQQCSPTEADVVTWWTEHPCDNVAILTGEDSGMFALDQDGPIGAASLAGYGPLPATRTNRTGGGGRQYLFQYPGWHVKTCAGLLDKVDVRGDGGYIVVAPSIHPATQQPYEWVDWSTPIAVAPEWLLDLIEQRSATPCRGKPKQATPRKRRTKKRRCPMTEADRQLALDCLRRLAAFRADDYQSWLEVGMALHAVDTAFLKHWDRWSQQSVKYVPGVCAHKWATFSGGGRGLGSLKYWANDDEQARGKANIITVRTPLPPWCMGLICNGATRSLGGTGVVAA